VGSRPPAVAELEDDGGGGERRHPEDPRGQCERLKGPGSRQDGLGSSRVGHLGTINMIRLRGLSIFSEFSKNDKIDALWNNDHRRLRSKTD